MDTRTTRVFKGVMADNTAAGVVLEDIAQTVASEIAVESVDTENLVDYCVTTVKIADSNVTTDKLNDLSVTTGKLDDLSVTTGKMALLSATTGVINDLAVTTGKVAANAITSAKLDPSVLQEANITIATGDVLTLNTTPIQVVAAPASGYALIPVMAVLMLDFNSVAYDGIAAGEDLEFRYTNSTGAVLATVETTGFLDATADETRVVATDYTTAAIEPTAAAKIVVWIASGNIATGNSPLKIRMYYRVVPTVL